MPSTDAPALVAAGITHASFCEIAKPIRYSRKDNPITLEGVMEHNCVGHALCGWPVGATTCPAKP